MLNLNKRNLIIGGGLLTLTGVGALYILRRL